MGTAANLSVIEDRFTDPKWRLNNLYTITDKDGNETQFRMNTAQEQFFDSLWYQNVILKARQLGFTTLIDLIILDNCMFNSNARAGIIAHSLEDAKTIFRDKVKFAYDKLEEGLKNANPAVQDSANALTFKNNSSVRVGTSLRSGTLQMLHVSEYGKICARYPEKAREIRTGALNTVAAGQMIWIESTAEGREGHFYDLCERAKALKAMGSKLTSMDWKFHFFPWHEDPSYVLDAAIVNITAEDKRYFEGLEDIGITLTDDQKAWYVKTAEDQKDDMKREYPATPEEAFEAAIEGAYFSRQMALARKQGRIGKVPFDSRLPVNTFWDLGMNDNMTIWLHQRHKMENRFIGYYENSGEGLGHYVNWLKDEWSSDKEVVWGKHYGPHDLAVRELGTGKTRLEAARELGIRFETVARPESKLDAIEAARGLLSTCWFDAAECDQGIKHLDGYRKEWNDNLGVWRDAPRHDAASHGADGFMTFAMGYKPAGKPSKINYPALPSIA